jgi:hypothetical protein
MLTLHKAYCSARVSKFVKDYIRQPRAPQEGLEASIVEILEVHWCTLLRSEDEALILVVVPHLLPLTLTVASKGLQHGLVEVYASALALGLFLYAPSASLRHGAPDLKYPSVEVDV